MGFSLPRLAAILVGLGLVVALVYGGGLRIIQTHKDSSTTTNNTGSIIATIVDWKTLKPISEFNVTQVYGPRPEKLSNAPGQFAIQGIWENSVAKVDILATGYLEVSRAFTLADGEKHKTVQIRLEPGGGLKGRVVNKSDHRPLAKAKGIVKQRTFMGDSDSGPEFITGSDGTFELKNLPAISGNLGVTPAGSQIEFPHPYEVTNGEVTNLGDIEISGGGTVRVKVLRTPGNKPERGVTVTLSASEDRDMITDENGETTFTGVSPGGYLLRLPECGVSYYSSPVDLADGETKSLELVLGRATLKGTVMQAGRPAVSADVWFSRKDSVFELVMHARTDKDGRFNLKNLTEGTWRCSVLPKDCAGVKELIEIREGAVQEKTIELPAGRILGRVIDQRGEPVSEARVEASISHGQDSSTTIARRDWHSTTTGQDGRFSLANIPQGRFDVTASKLHLGRTAEREVKVPTTGSSREVIIRLTGGGEGTLVSTAVGVENKRPITNGWVEVLDTSGLPVQHSSLDDYGEAARIEDLPTGTYRVEVSAPGYKTAEHTVEIKNGKTVTLQDVLTPAGGFIWGLQDKNGQPLAGVECALDPDDPTSIEEPRSGTTDRSGCWKSKGLLPGSYTATATQAGKPRTVRIEIRQGDDKRILTTLK